MDELKKYADHLFRKYGHTGEIEDLKSEILSNLTARKEDLMKEGMSEDCAVRTAMQGITQIDNLVEGNLKVYKNRFLLEALQNALLYCLTAWIIIIPCNITIAGKGLLMQSFLLWSILITGVIYLWMRVKKNTEFWNRTFYIRYGSLKKLRNISTLLTAVFLIIAWLGATGIHFASAIIYHNPVRVEGPYQWAVLCMDYLVPAAVIVIPLTLGRLPKLAQKYEVIDNAR